jgi:hypothetical protein
MLNVDHEVIKLLVYDVIMCTSILTNFHSYFHTEDAIANICYCDVVIIPIMMHPKSNSTTRLGHNVEMMKGR